MPRFKRIVCAPRNKSYATLEDDRDSLCADESADTQADVQISPNIWSCLEDLQKRITGWLEIDAQQDMSQGCEFSGKLHLDFNEGSVTDTATLCWSEFDPIATEPVSAIKGILISLELNIGMYLKNHKSFQATNALQHEEWANIYIPWSKDLEDAFNSNYKNWIENIFFFSTQMLPATLNDPDLNISYQVTAHCLSKIPEPFANFKFLCDKFSFPIAANKVLVATGHAQVMDPSRIISLDHGIGITGKLILTLPVSEFIFGETIKFRLSIFTFLVNKFAAKTIKVALIQRRYKRIKKFEEACDKDLATVTKLIEDDLQRGKEWPWEDQLIVPETGAQPTLRYFSVEFRHFLQVTLFNVNGDVAYRSETPLMLGTTKKQLELKYEPPTEEQVQIALNVEPSCIDSTNDEVLVNVNDADAIGDGIQGMTLRKRT